MSIYVFITRRADPLGAAGEAIAESEWLKTAVTEPDFRIPSEAEIADLNLPRVHPEHYLVWSGHAQYPTVWFEWHNGQIEVKNPDEPIICRMQRLARKLHAQVISEQGEVFDEAGHSLGFALDPDRQIDPPRVRFAGISSLFRRFFSRGSGT